MPVNWKRVDWVGKPRFHTFHRVSACTGASGAVTNWGPAGGFQRQTSEMVVLPASASSIVVWLRSSPTQIALYPSGAL